MISPAMQATCRIAAGEPMDGFYLTVTPGVTHGVIKYDNTLDLTLQSMYERWRGPTTRARAWPIMHDPRPLKHPVVTRLLLPLI